MLMLVSGQWDYRELPSKRICKVYFKQQQKKPLFSEKEEEISSPNVHNLHIAIKRRSCDGVILGSMGKTNSPILDIRHPHHHSSHLSQYGALSRTPRGRFLGGVARLGGGDAKKRQREWKLKGLDKHGNKRCWLTLVLWWWWCWEEKGG